MRVPRIYHPSKLANLQQITLSEEAAHHVARVLRMQPGQSLQLFDGTDHQYLAQIAHIDKKSVQVSIQAGQLCSRESPLKLHLGQVISRGEKMEFTIQKAVELGVNSITPLLSQRCGVKLNDQRLAKKHQQWQKIAIAACEQSGRNQLPQINPVQWLADWQQQPADAKLTLNPHNGQSVKSLHLAGDQVQLLIGPEGGLTEQEIAFAQQQGFINILLGPRVLRTETAALTAISALQVCFGDLA